jgi:hypothetical protein
MPAAFTGLGHFVVSLLWARAACGDERDLRCAFSSSRVSEELDDSR